MKRIIVESSLDRDLTPLAILLFLQGIIVIAVALAPEEFLIKKLTDDTFYFYETARHMAAGDGMTFDGIHRTNGMQIIWVFLLTPLYWSTDGLWMPVRISILVQGIISAVSVVLFYLAMDELFDRITALLAAVLWTLNPYVVFMYLGGHEGALNFLFISVVIYLVVTRTDDERSLIFLGLACGLAFLARLDNVFLIGILGGVLLGAGVLDTRRRFIAFSIAAGMLPLLYASYNLLSFGHLVPVSGRVLSTAETSTVVFYVFAWGFIGIATGYVFANRLGWDTVSRLLDRRLLVVTLVLVSVAHLFYYLYLHSTLRVWYLPIEVLVSSVVFALLFFVVSQHIPRVRVVTAVFLVLLLGSYGVVGAETKLDPNQGELGKLHYDQAVYLSQHTDCSVVIGSGNAGILGYFSERQVVELNGLANSYEFVERFQGNHSKYIRERQPDFVVDYLPHVEHKTLRETGYRKVRSISLVTEIQTPTKPVTMFAPRGRRFTHEVWMANGTELVENPSC